MSKTDKGFDFASMLFGASVVILGLTLYYGTSSITKAKLDHKERLATIEREIAHIKTRMNELDRQGARADVNIGHIIEKMIERSNDK